MTPETAVTIITRILDDAEAGRVTGLGETCEEALNEAIRLLRTHPQPVTPAGGEVDRKRPFAFYNADKGTFFWLNEEVGAPEKVTGIINLYTHPPVADAALVRSLESLCMWLLHRFGPDTPEGREAAPRLAALNQRGGGF